MVQGLLRQKGDFSREFIFIDDGSSDGSKFLIESLLKGVENCRIISQENKGPSIAFNLGLSLAKGKYIKALDGDDVLSLDATRFLLSAIKDSGCDFSFGRMGGASVVESLDESNNELIVISDPLRNSLKRAVTTPSMWLATKDLVFRSGGCDERVFIQDYSIELRMARLSPFAKINAVVFDAPKEAPGRLSDNEAQTLHDVNLALAYFFDDFPNLHDDYKKIALKRASGRAWKWDKRHLGTGYISRCFVRYLMNRLCPHENISEALFETCQVFSKSAAIRKVTL